MSEFNGGVPVLGQQKVKAPVGPPLALIRTLDENALFEPESTSLVNGQVMGITGRSNMVTAEDLVDMLVDALDDRLRKLIREEFRLFKTGNTDLPPELRR